MLFNFCGIIKFKLILIFNIYIIILSGKSNLNCPYINHKPISTLSAEPPLNHTLIRQNAFAFRLFVC